MNFKTCLFFFVSLSLVITISDAHRGCGEIGQKCHTGDDCCSGICIGFLKHCGAPVGGAIIPEGYQPPPLIPPMEQYPGQTNCAGLGSPCHTMDCCRPYYCGNYGNTCKSL